MNDTGGVSGRSAALAAAKGRGAMIRAVPLGCGGYLPEKVMTNADFAARLDTSDEWIRSRTGIGARHMAAEGELTSDLATAAARRALDHAGLTGADIDLVVIATATPDRTFPSTATKVQHAIGMTGGFAFDVQAVCAGFIYALSLADALIFKGQARRALIIGAETFSRILDWEDRTTCVLFGDGAGAVILGAHEGEGAPSDRGLLATCLHSDGAHQDILYVDGGPSSTQTSGKLRMQGREVFKHAVAKLAEVADEAMEKAGVASADIDWVVPHQANLRIIEATAKKAGVPMEKVILTLQDHGNTSAASIPLALSTAVHDGRIGRGDLLLMEAIGGGLVWGAALLRW
ncbi:3-oxoacyl-[acyl-carrier-protein] synthase III [Rubrimonas cliftonensis]|uniref:Beta-ketoacyl-[acyl-carrier-protein] synthase III n=2 Tax=Rubrimonas cliftonensis TaxID=89524 RepID=A0A1H3XDD6_9RHOB|nr:3-oxoacyl-[acyl-carrier-protein] synthase III [Rubrimonas cliftonensis]